MKLNSHSLTKYTTTTINLDIRRNMPLYSGKENQISTGVSKAAKVTFSRAISYVNFFFLESVVKLSEESFSSRRQLQYIENFVIRKIECRSLNHRAVQDKKEVWNFVAVLSI